MKLVQTLVVRDEADIVDVQIRYHLNAGVDFVVATDHQSVDGTTEILESYARDGVLRRISVTDAVMQDGPWRTRMARLAATEHGADWVLNTDADEFWMPRGGTLKDVLGSVPDSHGVVFALSRHFVPRPDDERSFAERMTVRVAPPAAIHDPTSPYRPHLKAAHRGDPAITISFGSHTVASPRWRQVEPSPHEQLDRYFPTPLFMQTASDDATVSPFAARGLHRALVPRYAAAPDRLRYLEHPGEGHMMSAAAWQRTWGETLAWFERFLRVPPA